jgi:CubicO group peptidase (beta-lactamase class C family)
MKAIPQHTLDFIDSWLTLREKWAELPGFAVAIHKDGQMVFNKAYGYANVATGEAMTVDHVFRIASHSKSFTAAAIMQLQEAGKLRIDDALVMYLPWLATHTDARWRQVTIRQLLSHSAGLVRDGLDSDYWQLRRSFPTRDELQAEILQADLVFESNVQMKYSNFGYGLLGLVIEVASGDSYSNYVTAHIFEPLGLTHTSTDYGATQPLATGYTRRTLQKDRFAFPHAVTNALQSATGLCSTTQDLCTFYSALMVGSGQLLSDVSKREMQRRQWKIKGERGDAYGFGLDVVDHKRRQLYGHSGGFPGFVTRTWFDPTDQLVVTVLVNAHGSRPQVMANTLIDIIDEFGDELPRAEHLKYEGRFGGQHGAYQVIAQPNGLRGIWPNNWWALEQVETLELVDDTTLKIVEASGFASPGELIHYTFNDDGTIHHVVHSGSYAELTDDDDMEKTWE